MKKSPIRFSFCKGTNLEPLSDCRWSEERGEWEVKWVQTDEGYCRDCDSTVQYEDANQPLKEFIIEGKETWQFKVGADTAEQAIAKVKHAKGWYRNEYIDIDEFKVVEERIVDGNGRTLTVITEA